MTATIEHDLRQLNRDLARYSALTGKAPEDILLKQGGKLAFYLSRGLKNLMPGRGTVTQERLAALRRGEGVYVRPKVRQSVYAKLGKRSGSVVTIGKGPAKQRKYLNGSAQAVKRELGLRESGRGFISFAARFGGLKGLKPNARQQFRDRYRQYLASVGLRTSHAQGTLVFAWGGGGSSDNAAKVLQQPRAQAQVTRAVRITADDIRKYTDRKMRENAQKAFR